MIYDLYLRENLKSHPSFEYDQKPYEKAVWEYRRQEKVPKTAHIEVTVRLAVLTWRIFVVCKVPDGYERLKNYGNV